MKIILTFKTPDIEKWASLGEIINIAIDANRKTANVIEVGD